MAAACVLTAFYIPIGAYDALFPRFLVDIGSSDILVGAALMAFAVPSVFLAGWASNNKYSLLGGIRAGAQMVSYEIAMGLSIIALLMSTATGFRSLA